MDDRRFDALTRSLTRAGSRRGVLAGLLAGALAVLGAQEREEAQAHDVSRACEGKEARRGDGA